MTEPSTPGLPPNLFWAYMRETCTDEQRAEIIRLVRSAVDEQQWPDFDAKCMRVEKLIAEGHSPRIIHAREFIDLPLPRTQAVADSEGIETWVERLAHPHREDQELYCDVPAQEAVTHIQCRVMGWPQRGADRALDRPIPWFVRLPFTSWQEYAYSESPLRRDVTVLDHLIDLLEPLEIIILVEAPLRVVATYEVEVTVPAPPLRAREALMEVHHPGGVLRPATAEEAEPVKLWREGRTAETTAVHWACTSHQPTGLEVLANWPRKPGAYGATRWLNAPTKRTMNATLMSDGSVRLS